jgi:hypothetical protein
MYALIVVYHLGILVYYIKHGFRLQSIYVLCFDSASGQLLCSCACASADGW